MGLGGRGRNPIARSGVWLTVRYVRIGLASATVLAIAACGLVPWASGADPDGDWRLVAGSLDGEPILIVDGSEPTLTIDGDELGGRAACNLYGGRLTREGDRVALDDLSVTEMACEPMIMASEAAYLAALTAIDTMVRADGNLTLRGGGAELRYALVPPVSAADLLGTDWMLDTLISGETATSVAGDPATLALHPDGTLQGSTGCRTFTGSYETGSGELRVVQLATDDRACPPELASQDDHVLSVVGDGFTATVDGNRLTLSSSGGLGLGYTVRE